MAKRPAHRPSKLTPELAATLLDAVRRTLYIETAADLAGIHRKTVWDWLKRGNKESSGIHHDLCNNIKKAIAEKTTEALENIYRASAREWTASAWLLERRLPGQWSNVSRELAALRREVTRLAKEAGGARTDVSVALPPGRQSPPPLGNTPPPPAD